MHVAVALYKHVTAVSAKFEVSYENVLYKFTVLIIIIIILIIIIYTLWCKDPEG